MFCVGGNGNTVLGHFKKKNHRVTEKRGGWKQSSGREQSLTINSVRNRRRHRGHRMRVGHPRVNYLQVEVNGTKGRKEILTEKTRQLS